MEIYNAICIQFVRIFLLNNICVFDIYIYIYIVLVPPPLVNISEKHVVFWRHSTREISLNPWSPPKEIIDADASGTLQITDPCPVKVGRLEMVGVHRLIW